MDENITLLDIETAAEIPHINGLAAILRSEGAQVDVVLSDTESPYLLMQADDKTFRLVYSIDGDPEEELFRLHFILRAEDVPAPDLSMETRCVSFNDDAHLSRAIYRPVQGEVILYYQLPETAYYPAEAYEYVLAIMIRELEEWRRNG